MTSSDCVKFCAFSVHPVGSLGELAAAENWMIAVKCEWYRPHSKSAAVSFGFNVNPTLVPKMSIFGFCSLATLKLARTFLMPLFSLCLLAYCDYALLLIRLIKSYIDCTGALKSRDLTTRHHIAKVDIARLVSVFE